MSRKAEVWAFLLPDDLTDVRICRLQRSDSEWQFYKITQEQLSEAQDIPFHSPDFLNDLDIAPGSKIIISCPARFCINRHVRMPPVDNKNLAAMVRYEASLNIPFSLESVAWDTVLSEDHSEVLISAARLDNIIPIVEAFNEALKNKSVQVDIVTPTFPALARLVQGEGARMVLNGMKECVIVSNDGTMWQRPLAVGTGEDEATRLENLVSELKRSLGFWQTFNREVEVESIILIGDEWTTQSVSFLQVNTNIRTVKACEYVPSLSGQVADEDVEIWALAQFTTDKSINLIRQYIAQKNRDYLKKVMVRTLVAAGIVLLVLIMGM